VRTNFRNELGLNEAKSECKVPNESGNVLV
jgi:hypothetical protein